MPQSPIQVQVVNPLAKTMLNVSIDETIKTKPGSVARVSVLTVGQNAGTINDCAAVGDASAANVVAPIPNQVGVFEIAMPCLVGITLMLGDGQVVSVSYQ